MIESSLRPNRAERRTHGFWRVYGRHSTVRRHLAGNRRRHGAAQPDTEQGQRSREAFWTVVVGVPAALSVLRLWVEAGGELQTTLLLVSNVGPLNLGAALFAVAAQLLTVLLIAVFAAGGILRASIDHSADASPLRAHPPFAARLAVAPAPWFVSATFVFAGLTWKILYLPLLVTAAVAITQIPPWRWHYNRLVAITGYLVAVVVYGWLVHPAVSDAFTTGEWQVVLLLVLPPLLALGVAGPLLDRLARLFAVLIPAAVVALAGLILWIAVNAPMLPLVVAEIGTKPDPTYLRGHVISIDDLHMVFLHEHGGVEYLPVNKVRSTVLCGTPAELPTYTTRIRGIHVEDSVLSSLGRHKRPRIQIDPLCRTALQSDSRYRPY